MIINRHLLKIKVKKKPITEAVFQKHMSDLKGRHNISDADANYFVFTGQVSNLAYSRKKQNINILNKNGKVVDIVKASDQLSLKALSKPVTKYYICYPKDEL